MVAYLSGITHNLTDDELIERLYEFVNKFVPYKLKYESKDEQEDCIQETIEYLYSRYLKLKEDEESFSTTNLDKFLYNRTRSFISVYLFKLKADRKAIKDYINYKKLADSGYEDNVVYLTNNHLLKHIVSKYEISEVEKEALYNLAKAKLTNKYSTNKHDTYTLPEDVNKELIDRLSITIIDEYMVENAIFEEGNLFGKTD